MKELIEQRINQVSNRTITTDEAIEDITNSVLKGRFVVLINADEGFEQHSIMFSSFEDAYMYKENSIYKHALFVAKLF